MSLVRQLDSSKERGSRESLRNPFESPKAFPRSLFAKSSHQPNPVGQVRAIIVEKPAIHQDSDGQVSNGIFARA